MSEWQPIRAMSPEPWQSEPAYLGTSLPEQRTLPHSEEAERAVLGAVLLDPELLVTVSRRLATEDFYLERHQTLYAAMAQLRGDGVMVDLRTLQATLERRGHFEEIGGIAYLASLDLDLPDLGRIDAYVEIVKERAIRRRLVEQVVRLTRAVLEGDPLPELVETQAAALEGARRALGGSGVGGYRPLREAVDHVVEELAEAAEKRPDRLEDLATWGFERFDARLVMERGTLHIVGGIPKSGKSAFMLQGAKQNALAGRGVGIQEMEMSPTSLGIRTIASQGLVSKGDMLDVLVGRKERLQPEQWRRVVTASVELQHTPIYVDTTRKLRPLDIGARWRRLVADHPEVAVIYLDYLGLATLEGLPGMAPKDPEHQKLGVFIRYLRELAGELNVVVIALAQLVREVGKLGRRPVPSDLLYGGEKDADSVSFVHREPSESDPARLNASGLLILGAAREGEPGSVPIIFEGWSQTFREPTSTELEEEAAAARAKRKPRNYEKE